MKERCLVKVRHGAGQRFVWHCSWSPRLRRWMKSICVRVGYEQYLNRIGPVYPAEGMCMQTHALLPLPLGHHFLDNEHYQCPQKLPKWLLDNARGISCSWNRLWFLLQGPNLSLIFILVSDKLPLQEVLNSHFWSRLVAQRNQATPLSSGLNTIICVYYAPGKAACNLFILELKFHLPVFSLNASCLILVDTFYRSLGLSWKLCFLPRTLRG